MAASHLGEVLSFSEAEDFNFDRRRTPVRIKDNETKRPSLKYFQNHYKIFGGILMNFIKSCEFNIDTACVEVKLADGSMVSIDCITVENEYANNMYEVSELDYLIYNEPMSYVRLLLSGKMEEYLKNNTDYTPLSDMR